MLDPHSRAFDLHLRVLLPGVFQKLIRHNAGSPEALRALRALHRGGSLGMILQDGLLGAWAVSLLSPSRLSYVQCAAYCPQSCAARTPPRCEE
jgi:hypothetical protein